jgi:hypothetical protein
MSWAAKGSGFQLAAVWIAAAACFTLVRWGLDAGTYQSTMQDTRVVRLSGVWPRSFASTMTAVFGAIALIASAWATKDWASARRSHGGRLKPKPRVRPSSIR